MALQALLAAPVPASPSPSPAPAPAAASNFLIPNATFFAEVIAFLIILAILWRYILPPLKKMMAERQAIIDQQMEDADATRLQLAEAQTEYQRSLAEARTQAAQIRESATAEAQRVVDDMHAQAREESARIVARGEELLANQRQATVRELRAEIGTLAVDLASKIVGETLQDDQRARATVDRFLADLDTASAGAAG
jgi:F-type H+-transporting ATPase subunit b